MVKKQLNPAKLVVGSFAAAIFLGAGLLSLPGASKSISINFLDALFTATSAVCVTGLSVFDVGSVLSHAGQYILLGLIQAGGLGIMTLSVFFMLLFRQKIALTSQLSVGFQPHHTDTRNLLYVLGSILGMVIFFEAVGAGLLYLKFQSLDFVDRPLFSAVFHAVSAFCNAGFSLFPDSLIRFQKEEYVPGIIMGLIIAGGLGFMLIDEIRQYLKARFKKQAFRLSLHTKICVSGTLILIVAGGWLIWLLERKNLLSGMGFPEQVTNAFFLSVTSRTAGFNTLDIGSLTNATLFFVSMLMFIGGCPGSTAGGIKVSTFAVLLALIKCQIQAKSSTQVMGRSIPREIIAQSLAIFTAGFILINVATFILQITEHSNTPDAVMKGRFLDFLFETTSAFGTVGLSTGVTPSLSPWGKLITILLMFFGRVGPLTAGVALLARSKGPAYRYVEEDIAIG